MSYQEAIADNIPMEKSNGFTWYYPPCYICGQPVSTWKYIRNQKYSCRICKELLVEQKYRMQQSTEMDKKEKKLEEAIRRVSKVTNIDKYESAIKIVRGCLDKNGWFQSTEEIMAALELTKCGYRVYPQTKVGKYKVDFIIPELSVALEIDGNLFHGKERKKYESIRDASITALLGEDWNVIRISTDNINKNITRLIPAIKGVIAYRKRKADPYTFTGRLEYKNL